MSEVIAPAVTEDAAAFEPDFDAVYGMTADGKILTRATFAPLAGLHTPDVALAPAPRDVDASASWQVLTGHTGQHGYRGAVMHPSELWSPCHVDDLRRLADTPAGWVAFSVVEVRDEDGGHPGGDPIGWAVAYWTPLSPERAAQVRDAHTLSPSGYCRCGLTPALTPAAHAAHVNAVLSTR